ncbi:MAG: HepT-like ribonuclease domain-containing protein [Planctomycetota bacterium]
MRSDRERLLDIVGMRHILVHDYFEIDKEVVVAVLEKDIPILKPQIEAILAEFCSVNPTENPSENT